MIKAVLATNGRFMQKPYLFGNDFSFNVHFPVREDYSDFSRRVDRIIAKEVIEIRSDTRMNYLKNRIRSLFVFWRK